MSLCFLGAGTSSKLRSFSVDDLSMDRMYEMKSEKCYAMQHLSSGVILCSGLEKVGDNINNSSNEVNPIFQYRITDDGLEVLKRYEEHRDTIWTIKMLDECRFATGCNDRYFKVWKLGKSESIFSKVEHGFSIRCIQNLTRTKPHIVWTGSVDRTIKIWDLNQEVVLETTKEEDHKHFVKSLILDETKNLMFSGAEKINCWDIRTNKATSSLNLLENVITMVFLRDENLMVIGGDLGTLSYHDIRKLTPKSVVKDDKLLNTRTGHGWFGMMRRGRGRRIRKANSKESNVLIPMVSPAKRIESLITLEDFFSDSSQQQHDRNEKRCFIASRGNEIYKFDRKTLKMMERYEIPMEERSDVGGENEEFKTLSIFKNDKKMMEYVNHTNDYNERTLYLVEFLTDFCIGMKSGYDNYEVEEQEGEDDNSNFRTRIQVCKIFLMS